MPIHTCSVIIPFGVDAQWTYVPNEEIDFKKYWYIRTLSIECYDPSSTTTTTTDGSNNHQTPDDCDIQFDQSYTRCSGYCCSNNVFDDDVNADYNNDNDNHEEDQPRRHQQPVVEPVEPYTMPSLKYLFPKLEKLIIKNRQGTNQTTFLGSLTNIPSTVVYLEIENTFIKNIGEIIMNSPNLLVLDLTNNKFPIDFTHLPPKLSRFCAFKETIPNMIHAHKYLSSVYIILSKFPGITNLHPNEVHSIMIRCGEHPYDETILKGSRCQPIIQHIQLVNAQEVYKHYGSIPLRIRIPNTEDDIQNPIIVALHLASNYPRRMAEFMTYV